MSRVLGDAGQHIGQPGLRIDVIHLGSRDQRGHDSGAIGTAPSIDLPEFLRGKAVELLRKLLTETITSELARGEEKELLEGGNDHNHG
jgi:hypothetical protein